MRHSPASETAEICRASRANGRPTSASASSTTASDATLATTIADGDTRAMAASCATSSRRPAAPDRVATQGSDTPRTIHCTVTNCSSTERAPTSGMPAPQFRT
jgi:hypothetical protein